MDRKMEYQELSSKIPSTFEGGEWVAFKVVLAADPTATFWAAYMGPTDWTDEQVKTNGDKMYGPEVPEKYLFKNSGMVYRG